MEVFKIKTFWVLATIISLNINICLGQQEKQQCPSIYDEVFTALKLNDRKSIKIQFDYVLTDFNKETIEMSGHFSKEEIQSLKNSLKEQFILCDEAKYYAHDIEINSHSKKDVKTIYRFSKPLNLSKHRAMILVGISYHEKFSSKPIRGGGDLYFILENDNIKSWKVVEKNHLVFY